MRSKTWIGLLAAGALATGLMGASFTSRAIQDYRIAYGPQPRNAYSSPAYDTALPEQQEFLPVDDRPAGGDGSGYGWNDLPLVASDTTEQTLGEEQWDDGYSYPQDPAYADADIYQPDNSFHAPYAVEDLGVSQGLATQSIDAAADAAARAGSVAHDVMEAEQQSD